MYYFENSRDFSITYSLLLHNGLRDHTLSMLEAEGGEGAGGWGGGFLGGHEILWTYIDEP